MLSQETPLKAGHEGLTSRWPLSLSLSANHAGKLSFFFPPAHLSLGRHVYLPRGWSLTYLNYPGVRLYLQPLRYKMFSQHRVMETSPLKENNWTVLIGCIASLFLSVWWTRLEVYQSLRLFPFFFKSDGVFPQNHWETLVLKKKKKKKVS